LTSRDLLQRSAQPITFAVGCVVLVGVGVAATTLVVRTGANEIGLLAVILVGLAAIGVLAGLAITQARRDSHSRDTELRELAAAKATLESSIADRTEHLREAIAEIRRSADIMHKTIISMADAVLVIDENGATIISNPAAHRLFGARADVGSPDWQKTYYRFRPDGVTPFPADLSPIGRAMRGEDVDNVEFALRREGDIRITQIIANGRVFRDPDGALRGAVLVYRDVTRLQETERQLRQAQKMEAVGQLTGGIAHDFNNILTVIMGTIGILTEEVAHRADLAAITQMIDEAAERGAELTKQLLAFARKQPLQPRITDINTLIVSAGKLLRPTLGERITIETKLEEGCNAFVDPSMLTSTLINLAVNGRDAMPDGGRLVIEASNVFLDETYASVNRDAAPGAYVMIAVSDSGCGIPAAIRDKVFDPFFTTKGIGKGTGLGLSMVYGFVKQSNGHIKLYSEEGYGTSIKIYLPRAGTGIEDAVTLVPAEKTAGGSETIFVVEDDDLLRSTLTAQLTSLGYTVRAAGDAGEALDMVRSGITFDLLLTDMILPGKMTGRQLADAVATMRVSLKVMFSSGYTENAVIHHGRLDPGLLLLPKPYRKEELARMVRVGLAHEAYRPSALSEPAQLRPPSNAGLA
jgi:signal transduction histidine kinase/ActR/RegA family two-component response regulator